jgi:Holliday junction resolvase RusA-like endonuclease
VTAHHEGRIGIRVYGTPITQGSKTKNRFGMHDDNAKTLHPWRKKVQQHAEFVTRLHDTLTGPVRVWIRFTFDRPPSHYRTGRNAHLLKDGAPAYPTHYNDIDKLQRAVFDALTQAEVWKDDGLIIDVRARKFYAGEDELALDRAGVDVIVEPLTQTTASTIGDDAVHTDQAVLL